MSAENLLSVITAAPAVPGVAAVAPASGEGDASAFESLLAQAAAETDAASAENLMLAGDIAQTVPAVPLPVVPTLLIETETKVQPEVLPGQEPTPVPDLTAQLKAADEPQILQGPGAEAPDGKAVVAPEILPGAPDLAVQPVAALDAETAAPTQQPAPEAAAALAGATAAATPPPPLPPQRTTPQPPTDKPATKTSGEDFDRPPVLPGSDEEGPTPPPPAEPRVGPDRPRPGLTARTDGATPTLERAAAPADSVLAKPVTPEPTSLDLGVKLDAAATTTLARDASLSSLSRATIETTAQIAAQITRRLEGRSTRFEMALTPEGLGRVDISLDIDADGQLAARLAFDNPIAAIDMRGRVDELRRQLEDQGFKLADDALQFTERDPQSRGDGFDGRRERAFARSNRLNDDVDLEISAPIAGRWMSLSLTPDRVDLKV